MYVQVYFLCVNPDRVPVIVSTARPDSSGSTQFQQDIHCALWSAEVWEAVPHPAGPTWWINDHY